MKALRLVCLLLAACGLASGQGGEDKAWSLLDAGAKNRTTDRRAKAVRALGLLARNDHALGLALSALRDRQAAVRAAAATALGQMGASAAIPQLKEALKDKDSSVVLAAAGALLSLKDGSAYDVYYAVLTRRQKVGEGRLTAQARMLKDPKRMAQFGFEEGIGIVPFAGVGYSALQAAKRDDPSAVRAAAAKTLAADPDPRSGAALVEATHDKSWLVRAAALDALARRNDAKLLHDIEPALDDPKDVVQFTAAAAVISLSASAARPVHPVVRRGKVPSSR